MSIRYIEAGDLRDDPADVLVCAVNLVPGAMGAGQALAFADRWPHLPGRHRSSVASGLLKLGEPVIVAGDHRDICFFPTKDYWREPSKLKWIREGLSSIILIRRHHPFRSIALPALGCGLGCLDWADVKPLIERAATKLPEVEWRVYEPGAEKKPPF